MQKGASIKVWLYLSALALLLMYAGLKLGDRHGLLVGFLAALAINALVFFFPDLRLAKRFRGELLEGQDPWGMLSILTRLASKAGIDAPKLYLRGISTPTVLSYGLSSGQNAILVSAGLVREFTKDEIEAVLALEIARLCRHDTALSTAAAAISAAIGTFARAIDNYFFFRGIRTKRILRGQPTTKLLFPVASIIIRLLVRPPNFYAADAVAAELIQNPQRIAEVLWKLHSFQNTLPFEIKVTDVALFSVSPLEGSRWYRQFQPQPAMEQRIKLLLGYYPI